PCGEVQTEFFFGSSKVSFDRAEWPGEQVGDFAVRLTLLKREVDGELLVGGQLTERHRKIVPQVRAADVGRLGELAGGLGERDVIALTAARIAPEIVSDPEQPCGETGLAAEAVESAIGLNEG